MTSQHSRRTFLQTSMLATAALTAPQHLFAAMLPPKPSFPVSDYHVHLSNALSIEQAVTVAKERGVQIGIVEHPGPGYAINTDTELMRYIDRLRKHPVRVGLQPVYAGWSKNFSQNVLIQLDYVLMDALTLPVLTADGLPSGRSTPWSTTKKSS